MGTGDSRCRDPRDGKVRGVFYTAAFLLLLLIPCHIAVFRRIMRQRYFAAHYKAVMSGK